MEKNMQIWFAIPEIILLSKSYKFELMEEWAKGGGGGERGIQEV